MSLERKRKCSIGMGLIQLAPSTKIHKTTADENPITVTSSQSSSFTHVHGSKYALPNEINRIKQWSVQYKEELQICINHFRDERQIEYEQALQEFQNFPTDIWKQIYEFFLSQEHPVAGIHDEYSPDLVKIDLEHHRVQFKAQQTTRKEHILFAPVHSISEPKLLMWTFDVEHIGDTKQLQYPYFHFCLGGKEYIPDLQRYRLTQRGPSCVYKNSHESQIHSGDRLFFVLDLFTKLWFILCQQRKQSKVKKLCTIEFSTVDICFVQFELMANIKMTVRLFDFIEVDSYENNKQLTELEFYKRIH